jgi:hypothetical protein
MGINSILRRGRIKRVSGHKLFHKDKSYGFEFYYKFTNDNDLTIMAFDAQNKTYREFILDDVIVSAMFKVVDGSKLKTDDKFAVDKMSVPTIVADYVTAGFTVLKKTGTSKFANVVVLAKMGDFGKDKSKALVLRRVVYNDTLVIGLDTLALPLNAVNAFVKTMEVYFKTERGLVKAVKPATAATKTTKIKGTK